MTITGHQIDWTGWSWPCDQTGNKSLSNLSFQVLYFINLSSNENNFSKVNSLKIPKNGTTK
jgi:hypothetical protein